MSLITILFPSLYEKALQKTIEQLTQHTNNQDFKLKIFFSKTIPQKIASDLFQHLHNSSLAAHFITVHSPNPLTLSNVKLKIEEVLNSLKEVQPHITSVKISNTALCAHTIRAVLEKFPNLKILKISECSFAPDGLAPLLEGIQLIGQLELSYVSLNSAEVGLLADYFHSNSSLQRLVLEHLHFEEESQKEILTEKLLLSLDGHPQLSSLEYENNGLGQRSIAAAGQVIESCPVLNKVKLTFDLFSDNGTKKLIPALAKKSNFVLDLSENYLNNESRLELLKTGKVILPK